MAVRSVPTLKVPSSQRPRQPGYRIPILAAIIGSLGLLACLMTYKPAQAFEVVRRSDIDAVRPKIEAYIRKSMQEWNTPGLAIGIVAEDELVYAKGFGVREIGRDAPVTSETVFQIGSTTKAFLGVTQAMLVEEGKLAWEDRVIDHEPNFRLVDPWVTREFRIFDLIAQRSGLPGYAATNMMIYGYGADSIIQALAHIKPVTSFRSTFAYQNAFHLVAGRIVARLGGTESWADFLETRLLGPLGMTMTSATAQGLQQAADHASGHRYDTDVNVVDSFGAFPYGAEGAGALNSNVKDLAHWVRFHLNGGEIDGRRIINRAALQETYHPRIHLSGPMHELVRLGENDLTSYATGWIIHSTPEGRVIEHGGGTIGFVSHISFDPDRRFGVIVLVNQSFNIGSGLALPIGRYILDALQGRPETDYAAEALINVRQIAANERKAEAANSDYKLPTETLQAYTGSYESPVLGRIDVALAEDGILTFRLGPHQVPVRLQPRPGNNFIATIPAAVFEGSPHTDKVTLQFQADETGRISQIHWLGSGDQSGQPPFRRINPSDS